MQASLLTTPESQNILATNFEMSSEMKYIKNNFALLPMVITSWRHTNREVSHVEIMEKDLLILFHA